MTEAVVRKKCRHDFDIIFDWDAGKGWFGREDYFGSGALPSKLRASTSTAMELRAEAELCYWESEILRFLLYVVQKSYAISESNICMRRRAVMAVLKR